MEFVKSKLGGNIKKLESHFVERLLQIVKDLPTKNGYIGKDATIFV